MSKVFNPQNLLKLENEERYRAIPPLETLINVGLKAHHTVADIGCGTGYFSVPAAERIFPSTLYAADIAPEMLNHLSKRLQKNDIHNIEMVKMEPLSIPLPDEFIDFTFCSFVLHEAPHFTQFTEELLRITKPGGKVVILEWSLSESPFGPPQSHRLDPETVNGFIDSKVVTSKELMFIGDWFYAIIAHKREG